MVDSSFIAVKIYYLYENWKIPIILHVFATSIAGQKTLCSYIDYIMYNIIKFCTSYDSDEIVIS